MQSEPNAQSQEQATRKTIDGFNEAFNRHDADGLAKFLTEDTVFEDTSPAPDGRRIEGKATVVEFWRGWFVRNADAQFEAEEVIVSGNRATVLSEYTHRARHRREIPPGSALIWPCNQRVSYRLILASRGHVRANLLQVTLSGESAF